MDDGEQDSSYILSRSTSADQRRIETRTQFSPRATRSGFAWTKIDVPANLCILRTTQAGCVLGNSKACAAATRLPGGLAEPIKAHDLDIYNDNENDNDDKDDDTDQGEYDKNDDKENDDDDNNDDVDIDIDDDEHEKVEHRNETKCGKQNIRSWFTLRMFSPSNSCNDHQSSGNQGPVRELLIDALNVFADKYTSRYVRETRERGRGRS